MPFDREILFILTLIVGFAIGGACVIHGTAFLFKFCKEKIRNLFNHSALGE